jgi:hypothetical protein
MQHKNILSATTTVCKSGFGKLSKIVINKAVASAVVTVYDNTAGSGTIIATITMPAVLLQTHVTLDYECHFGTGLTVVTSSTADITVVFD